MSSNTDKKGLRPTTRLNEDKLWDLSLMVPDVKFRPVPHTDGAEGTTWRVRLDLTFDPARHLGLDINGEVTFGRGEDGPGFVGLGSFDADMLGVSRLHCIIRPTDSKLYILDLGSTNGTRLNGRSIGMNTPYGLSNGDLLSIGKLEFAVRIIKQPSGHTAALRVKADLADTVLPIAKAIVSQLSVEAVLKQALEMTMAAVAVDEVSIWLVDENTGELFLEAERGITEEHIRRMRLSVADTLPGKVVATGKPVRANRQSGDDQIKVKTGYLVNSVIYVPLALGGVTFGVLSAANRKEIKALSTQDEKIIASIAEFTAIAVQNARLYRSTDHALTRRTKAVTALDYIISYDFKKLLNSALGNAGLLKSFGTVSDETSELIENILTAGNRMSHLIEKLSEFVALGDPTHFRYGQCDLVDTVARAVDDLQDTASARSITLNFKLMGERPYMILGDSAYLYRSVFNLTDNAIRYSPDGAEVSVVLVFGDEIMIRVRDTGPGIPEEDLPCLFDKYIRGSQSFDGQGGIGLGLEVVRATVEAHRGKVIARNVDDHGAEFIITLPSSLRV